METLTILASGKEILELIPQRHPVVMVDKLLLSKHDRVISGFTILEDNIFCEDGHLSASGLIENIAQTAAAGVGYICKIENRKVPIGFIASVKDLKIIKLPAIGSDIRTELNVLNQIMDVTIVKGTVTFNDELMAECEMRIFIKPDKQ